MARLSRETLGRIVQLVGLFFLAIHLVILSRTLGPGGYMVMGNLHDLFIPINSAYALEQGMVLHHGFHSPFGLVYHLINHWSFGITQAFPGTFQLMDMILLSSALMAVPLTLLFLGVRSIQAPGHRIGAWSFLVLFTLLFQVRDPNELLGLRPYWYAIYNHHGWALLMLQAVLCLSWNIRPPTARSTRAFSVLQAAFLLIAMHYKVSFFAATGLLCVAGLLTVPRRHLADYLLPGPALALAATAALALGGYSHAGLLADNLLAVEARGTGIADSPPFTGSILGALAFVLGMQVARTAAAVTLTPAGSAAGLLGNLLREGILPRLDWRLLLLDLMVAGAIFLATAGDYRRPFVYYLLTLWMYSAIAPRTGRMPGLLPTALAGVTAVFLWTNIKASELNAQGKRWEQQLASGVLSTLRSMTIGTAAGPIALTLPNDPTFRDFVSEGIFVLADTGPETLLRRSYSFQDDIRRPAYMLNSGAQFVEEVNVIADRLRAYGVRPGDGTLVEAVGFTNPYPFVLGEPMPAESFNWVHFGTTMTPARFDRIVEDFAAADFVVFPVRDRLHLEDRVYMTCRFYLWNIDSGKPFLGVEMVGQGIIFASRAAAERFGLSETVVPDEAHLRAECAKAPGRLHDF